MSVHSERNEGDEGIFRQFFEYHAKSAMSKKSRFWPFFTFCWRFEGKGLQSVGKSPKQSHFTTLLNEIFREYFLTMWTSGHILNLSWPQKKLFLKNEIVVKLIIVQLLLRNFTFIKIMQLCTCIEIRWRGWHSVIKTIYEKNHPSLNFNLWTFPKELKLITKTISFCSEENGD